MSERTTDDPQPPTHGLRRRLKWTFLASVLVLVAILEYARFLLFPYFDTLAGRLTMDAVVLVGVLFLFGWAFAIVSRLQEQLEHQNRELLALHRAGLDIYGELSLDSVLGKVVDQARLLLEARYGAIAVYEDEGNVAQFATSGISEERRERIGDPPRGRGLLGVVLHEGQRLRFADMTRDPRSEGFPPHHPEMKSLLAVPILCKSSFRGNLYVTDKESGEAFSAEDEETLVRFATAAAIAIDNTDLHQRLRTLAVAEERVRIAREMHDGMAQVLAYVNTKAQAVQEFLRAGKADRAGEQLEQLAAAAREVYTDVREGILALRTPVRSGGGLAEALEEFVHRWQQQSDLEVDLDVDVSGGWPPTVELQVLRILQEALSNVRKHSGAERAWLRCREVDGGLVAEVRDDGVGFAPEARQRGHLPRFGLAIMRERAEAIGAELTVDSAPGEGTRVTMTLLKTP